MKLPSYVKVKNRGQVTIPVEFRNQLRLGEGDILEVAVKQDSIVFKPQTVVDRKSIDVAFEEGVKEYRSGRTHGPFKNMKEFKKSLQGE